MLLLIPFLRVGRPEGAPPMKRAGPGDKPLFNEAFIAYPLLYLSHLHLVQMRKRGGMQPSCPPPPSLAGRGAMRAATRECKPERVKCSLRETNSKACLKSS
uniref:Uncharacterized protein n=1 Tax=Morchella importuna TaxID=1174673 RepID=A0A650AFF2_9PEZI|nr:hypothetical protein [Morchella importuna]QGN66773.1 hypothetical protein [Morchella importuna]